MSQYPLSYNLEPTTNETNYQSEYEAPSNYYETQNLNNSIDNTNNYSNLFENGHNTLAYIPANSSL